METEEYDGCHQDQDQVSRTPFARGGPIYVPDLVGPLNSILEFKASVVQELQSLEAELSTAGGFDDELSVDELKVFTEEELVEKALKEFEETENAQNSSQGLVACSNERANGLAMSSKEVVCTESSVTEGANLDCCVSMDGSSMIPYNKDTLEKKGPQNSKKRKKRGRVFDRDSRAAELDSINFTKVEHYAKIKEKQDEDKAAARLHSFNGSSKSIECLISTSEKIERLRSLRFITSPMKMKLSNTQQFIPLHNPEVVLCIEVYHNKLVGKKTQEFLVLGRQTLAEFRDNIYCLTDQLMQTAGQHDPSGYFLIEDFFCDDLRDPSAIRYSKPILDWLRNCKNEAEEKWEYIISGELKKKHKELLGNLTTTNLPQFKAVDMHKTRFCDLRFRVGAGYLYCHQGDCKHIIVIRDMRLIHPEDDQNQAAYPILTFQLRVRYRKCSVCCIYRATKMTVDDKWAGMNPCYFCENCYYLLHYKEDGTLLYDEFNVYDYHHE